MQPAKSFSISRKSGVSVLACLLLSLAGFSIQAQDPTIPTEKHVPTKIEKQILIFGDPVVQVQWPHMLKLVNAPQNVTLLNPGQCIRVGIIATGDSRDAYLDQTRLSFRVRFNGKTEDNALAAVAETKQIKPEGGDFVTETLAAANIKNPMLTMASLGASAAIWCVPADAADGTATVEAEVESPSGHQNETAAKVQIESFETGSKMTFKGLEGMGNFMQSYYRQPNPARLVPLLQYVIVAQSADQSSDIISNASAFFVAALKADPIAAKDFLARMPAQTPLTRAVGLAALRAAGYDISSVVKTLSASEQDRLNSVPPMPDPYALAQTAQIGAQLDMLWVTFGATGQFEPVKTIAGTVAWRSDYEDFDKMRKSGTHPSEVTPGLARALGYMAAGWSMGSFQRTDPLVADYIEFMLASPDISPAVKAELSGLATNPAFKRDQAK
jgi:hypothetical protein